MKLTFFLSLFAALIISCSTTGKNDQSKKIIDKKLIGTWEGNMNSFRFTTKNWEITRNVDGTFNAVNAMKVKNVNRRSTTSGTWWTNNGKYYQQTIGDEGVMTYTYTVENSKQVKFKSTSVDAPEEFTEIKK